MDTATVRYVGPHTEGVEIAWGDDVLVIPHGEWLELPAALVHGEPATLVKGYKPAAGEDLDPDRVVSFGRASLLDAAEVDAESGEPVPLWELQGAPPAPSSTSRARRAGAKKENG